MLKKLLQFASVALLLAVPLGLRAQSSTLTTCNGTASNQYVPFYGYYADDDQHNQMLYPADSLTAMQGSAITQMVFYIDPNGDNGSNTSADRMGIWTVSLGTCTDATLSGLNTTAPVDECYEGYFDCSTGTLTILFESPFVYNGGNLLVDIQHEAASYNRWYFLGATTTGNMSYNSQQSSAYGFLPKVTFTYGSAPTCFRVQSLSATDILSDGLTLNWVDSLNAPTTYTLRYWPNNAGEFDTVEVPGVVGSSYVVSNLNAAMVYYFSIVPDCSDGDVPARTAMFTTDCENGSCDITVNAVDTYGDGWNGNAINVYQNGALMGSVTIASGESYTGIVSVCAGAPVKLTFTRGSYPDEMSGNVLDGGGNTIFTIEGMDNRSNGDSLAGVENACPDCSSPTNLASHFDEDGNVVFTWNGSASAYIVYAGDSVYGSYVDDTTFTFSGFSSSSVYQLGVASLCDDEDTSGIARLAVVTPCGAISNVPWSTSFETDVQNDSPLCWTTLKTTESYNGTCPYVYSSSYNANTGSKSVYFYSDYEDDTCFIATSPITYNPGNLHVQYWMYTYFGSGAVFEAGIMTDLTDPATFVPLNTYDMNTPGYSSYALMQGEFYTDLLGLEEGDSAYLAFRLRSGYGYIYLDDVSIKSIPNCRMPISGSGVIDSIRHESAYFAWQGSSEHGYDLMLTHYEYDTLGNVTDTVISHIFTDTNFVRVDTLIANTLYNAQVATLCEVDGEADTTSYLDLGPFQTQLRCYPVYRANLGTVTNTAAVVSWSYRDNMGIAGTGAIVTLTDLDATTAPVVQTVTGTTSISFSGLVPGHTYSVTLDGLCGAIDTAEAITLYFTTHGPGCAQAFTDAQVGTSYATSSPIYYYNDYSFSQTLYGDSILAGIDTLTGVAYDAYFYNEGNIGVNNYDVDMYIGFVDTADLTLYNGRYWLTSTVPVDSTMTQVVTSGKLSVTRNGWTFLGFDTPYAVPAPDSAKRLIVTVVSHKLGMENGYNYWRGYYDYTYDYNTYAGYYQSRYGYSSNSFSVANLPSSYGSSTVSNIQFFGDCSGDCMAPSVAISGTTQNSIDVQWFANGVESSWKVEYKLPADTSWTSVTVNASPYTITGLSAGTAYNVRVGAICTDTVVYSAPSVVYTACGSIVPPYSVLLTTANPCWTANISPNSENGYNIYSTYTLMSPEIGASLDTLMLRITDRCYSTTATNQRYKVSACNADGTNKVLLASIVATEGSNFGVHTIYLANYTGTQNRFIIEADGGDVYIKQVDIDYLPACMPAMALTQDTATENSITVSWTVASSNNGFTVDYRPYGTTTWSSVTTNADSIVLTGLTPSTNYEVRIATNCTDGTTMHSDVLIASTACVPMAVPYNMPEFYMIPACWSTYNTGHPSVTWASSVNPTNGYLYSAATGSNNAINDWLITPAFVIPATAQADSIMLVYQIAGSTDSYSTNSAATYELRISPNGGDLLTDFTDTLITESVNTNTFEFRRISMAQYAGDTVRFAFRSTCAAYGMVGMTNFGIRSVLLPMYYMSGNSTVFTRDTNTYNAVRIEGDSNTVSFTWTSSMAAAGQATMMNASTSSMSIIYSAGGIDTLTLISTNPYGSDTTIGIVTVFDCNPINSFPYTNGFESDDACWTKVYGDGDPTVNPMIITSEVGNALGVHEGNTVFRFSSYSTSSDYNQYLISPELVGTDLVLNYWAAKYGNSDSLWVGYSTTTREVSAFTWIAKTDLSSSSWTEYTDTLPANTKFVAFRYWGNWAYYVYLDDLTITGTGVGCDNPVVSSTIVAETTTTISWTGTADNYEVAIVEGTWDSTTTATPIALTDTTYTFSGLTAATEYTIGVRAVCGQNNMSEWALIPIITDEHPCFTPSALTVSDVTLTSATLGWTIGEAETEWELHVTGTNFDQTYTVTTNPYTLTGLTSGVEYSFTVTALCSATQRSEASEAQNFTTLTCQPVTGVEAGSITTSGATITWTAPEGVSNFEIEYGESGFARGTGTTVTVNAPSYAITGLDANMLYDVFVRSVCAADVYSSWSDMVSFTTADQSGPIGIDDVDNASIALFPNPATTSVTLTGIDGQATVTIVDMNGREVYTQAIKQSNTQAITIDLTGYAQGAYFVRVTSEQQQAIRKLIVK